VTTTDDELIESLTFERDAALKALEDYKAQVRGAQWLAQEVTDLPPEVHGYVVVLFGSSAEGWCSLNKCPMGLASWFPTRQGAEEYSSRMPGWTQPHILSVLKESGQ
jgi:hypothetical protein